MLIMIVMHLHIFDHVKFTHSQKIAAYHFGHNLEPSNRKLTETKLMWKSKLDGLYWQWMPHTGMYDITSTNSVFSSTARLRGVHDGLFTGQIDAVDTSAATYRVTFDRSGLGTHTVPDYEVLVRLTSCL